MLTHISTHDVEPFGDLDLSLAPRLTLLAGDNGLGKTFVLELAWWALTNTWSRHPALPRLGEGVKPLIECYYDGWNSIEARFQFGDLRWARNDDSPMPGAPRWLVIYAKADGGFDIHDPYRISEPSKLPSSFLAPSSSYRFSFNPEAIWDGLIPEDGPPLCNGLIRDWVAWQFQRPALFDLFTRVLSTLSPHPSELIRPGAPRRISIEDARDIPTIDLPYGNVPVTHASAGMKRILALAYMLVWTFHEHTEAARLRNTAPLNELVLLFDEVEAHLHPRWQRVLLPALFEVMKAIAPSLKVQLIASTHAPLVLASTETLFDEEQDKLIHFALEGGRITVEDLPFAKQGDASNWLVSEAFGLEQARSPEAERAIEAAEAFMRGDPTPPNLDTREKIHAELSRVLAGHDDFWPRWLVETGVVK